jgi:WD40 repeat protein
MDNRYRDTTHTHTHTHTHKQTYCMFISSIKIFDDDAHALSGSKDRNIICWDLRHERRVCAANVLLMCC